MAQTLSDDARAWFIEHENRNPLYRKAVYSLPYGGVLVGIDCAEVELPAKLRPLKVHKRNSSQSNSEHLQVRSSLKLEDYGRAWFVFIHSVDSPSSQLIPAIRHGFYIAGVFNLSQFWWGELDIREQFLDNYTLQRTPETREGLERKLAELTSKAA
jgi:hypothetical protein